MTGCGSRRQVVLGAGASLLALGLARAVRAREAMGQALDDPLARLLGQALPPQVRALLPGEVTGLAEIVSGVMGLEREASAGALPLSPLSVREDALPADADMLYQLALPRLVALVDRAERVDPAFAERAGDLLARLHATQHIVAEALGGLRLPALVAPGKGPLRLDGEPGEAAAPPILDFPGAETPEPAPTAAPAPPPLPPISRSLKFPDLAEEYRARFAALEVKPQHLDSANWHLTMMRQSKKRYVRVGELNGVPWYFIAAIHGLEASFNFRAHMHNGDYPLSQRTRQVPSGRPTVWLPPSDWEASATDALRLMGFAGAKDWSLPRILYRLEAYNGFGYRKLGRASPYLWSFSNLYDRGKFIADGRFSATARSQQCGAAVMLKVLANAGEVELA